MRESEERATSGLADAASAHHADGPPASFSAELAADEQIRIRAYELYRERGGAVGDDLSDWLRAEREYHERGLRGSSPGTADQSAPPAS